MVNLKAQILNGRVLDASDQCLLLVGGGDGANARLLKLNSDGTLATPSAASAGASVVYSTAQEKSHVLKASAGTLISLVGYNANAGVQFIQLHDAASLPADTAVPVYSFPVQGLSPFSLDVPITGIPFTTGIVVCNSSTQPTKTLGASSDCWFTAVIK